MQSACQSLNDKAFKIMHQSLVRFIEDESVICNSVNNIQFNANRCNLVEKVKVKTELNAKFMAPCSQNNGLFIRFPCFCARNLFLRSRF